jgi:ketosteroid isomerase-like protein
MSAAEATVRRLRTASNAAIAARDAEAVAGFMAPDVIVRVSGGPVLRGRAANRAAFAQQMAEPTFRGYVRTTERVESHADPLVLTERGRWVGRWQAAAGMHEQLGTYVAEWRHDGVGWLIHTETYVSGR